MAVSGEASVARWRRVAALSAALVLAALGLLHVVWLRSTWPFATREQMLRTVVGSLDADKAPSVAATAIVAALLFMAAWIVLAAGHWAIWPLPARSRRIAMQVLGCTFLMRAVAGWVVSGWLKLPVEPFRHWDIWLYAPLTMLLGVAALTLAPRPASTPSRDNA